MGCSECSGERESGLSGYFKLGGTVNERLLIGFETNGWTKEEDGVTLSQGNASAVAFFYPQPENGFSLTPYANFVYGSFDGGTTNVIQAGVGLSWH